MFSFNTTVKSGLVALAILIAMLSIRIASANTDADWAIHHDVYQDTVNLINLYNSDPTRSWLWWDQRRIRVTPSP